MSDDQKIELYGNSLLKGSFGISPEIPYLSGRHDTLLDVNLVLWVDQIKWFNWIIN